MFESMRKHAKIVIYIVAFIFIVGMGLMGVTQILTPKPFVGKIAGLKISPADYKTMFDNAMYNYQVNNPDKELTEQIHQQVSDQTWNQLVTRTIYDNELKRRRIKVTTDEIADKLMNEPPDAVKSLEGLMTEGKFDLDKYMEILTTDDQFAYQVEAMITANLPYEKLMDEIYAEAEVTEEDVKQEYIDKNNKADAEVLFFDPNALKDEDIEFTDEDLLAFYEENKEEKYKRDPGCKYKYVRIKAEPSVADSMSAKTKADSIYNLVMNGADFAQTAIDYSEGPSAPKGGDLGFFAKGKMVKEFSDVAFALKRGDISKPVKSQFGWHIIKRFGTRKDDKGEQEVQASHILFEVKASEETKQKLEILSYDLFELAGEKGLDTAGEELAYKVEESREFMEDGKYLPGVGQAEDMVKFAFKNKVGSVYDPKQLDNGDYIIGEVSSKLGIHFQDFEEIKSQIEYQVKKTKKVEKTLILAKEFMAETKPEDIFKLGEKRNWKVEDAKGIAIDGRVGSAGKSEALNTAMLALEEGQATELITDDKGAYYAVVNKRYQPDMEKFETEKETLLEKAIEKAETEHLNEWYKEQVEKANVVDNRSDFF
jgi:peptidyl-prolyl cis-trans isomerase D